ncbi:MAG: hypothetical protein M1837_005111 [Sclerophora amabilis]|nr:MAG: hypothetical protein M1837_005111 [Sclerophora amabilis]
MTRRNGRVVLEWFVEDPLTQRDLNSSPSDTPCRWITALFNIKRTRKVFIFFGTQLIDRPNDMTRTLGGVGISQDGPASPSRGKAADWPSLPSGASEVLREDTIFIKDPAKILAVHKAERRKNFQSLVKRYISQLVYGCGHPACTTSTCFTFREKVSPGPVRRLAPVSARTVACYLATRENPDAGLCPHGPVVEPNMDDSTRKARVPARKDKIRHLTIPNENQAPPARKSQIRRRSKSDKATPISSEVDVRGDIQREAQKLETVARMRRHKALSKPQKQKDPKSFTQNLFDTFAMRMIEWLPLPTPLGVSMSWSGKAGETVMQHAPVDTPNETHNPIPVELEKRRGIQLKTLETPEISGGRRDTPEDDWSESKSANKGPFLDPSSTNLPSTTNNFQAGLDPCILRDIPNGHQDLADTKRLNGFRATVQRGEERELGTEPTKVKEAYTTPSHKMENFRLGGAQLDDIPRYPQDLLRRHGENVESLSDLTKPQSLSYLSFSNVREMVKLVRSSAVSSAEERRLYSLRQGGASMTAGLPATDVGSTYQQAVSFMDQSIFHGLSDPDAISNSFNESHIPAKESLPNKSLRHTERLSSTFRSLLERKHDLIFHSLWLGVGSLFNPPSELVPPKSPKMKAVLSQGSVGSESRIQRIESSSAVSTRYVSDSEASHIIMLCLHALAAALPAQMSDGGFAIRQLRARGKIGPDVAFKNPEKGVIQQTEELAKCVDALESELPLRLIYRLLKAVAAREHYAHASKTRSKTMDTLTRFSTEGLCLKDLLLDNFARYFQMAFPSSDSTPDKQVASRLTQTPNSSTTSNWSLPVMAVEWVRSIILKEWDGKAEVSRLSAVGGAIIFLSYLYEERDRIGLSTDLFCMPFFSDRLDPMEMPLEWQSSTSSSKTMHLLSHPFLFPPSALVTYFRALNFSNMSRAFEGSMMTLRMIIHMAHADPTEHGLIDRLRTAINTYLVLEIRREHVLLDAMNQLWRREKRELMRPLKVRMGMEEGEEGVDHGGVQQEFFRIAIAEALNPDYGVFATDSKTRLSWFQPGSLEPLYKFELLGLLASLAIYNGATLPLNFPQALYRKLLGLHVKHEHIKDGWPDLANGLSSLLKWDNGDVGDVFMRTYEFSVEAWGQTIHVDMEKVREDDPWPGIYAINGSSKPKTTSSKGKDNVSLERIEEELIKNGGDNNVRSSHHLTNGFNAPGPPPEQDDEPSEASLVTNENRHRFVEDYVFWLTDKSVRPQYEAFAKGFFACLEKKSVSIFTPEALQIVVEGLQDVDIDRLQQTARYEDGYSASHRVIREFWSIVKTYSAEKRRDLLEFVTASDRVPANGVGSILFVIQRNGPDSERVPTSLTCFGRLLLPEYSSKKKLKEKLRLALENGKGFGVP